MTTAWPRVVATCAGLGVTFDGWQHGIGQAALGKRKDGKYAATVGGVCLSIPRQVGKTFLVGMIVIALCLIHPGLTVLWSAHRTRTATKTFQTLKGMTSRAKVKPHMLEPRNANGEQEVRFRNGSVIMFGAREQGFGRGFDEVDVEVFDEAQILTERALEDMVPATNQSRQEAGALLFFMGTPPRPSDGEKGDEFTNRRAMALSGRSRDMVYVELSADPDADPDDRKQWAKANPSFPGHTPVEAMLRMRANLTDVDSFRREGLGIWDDVATNRPIPVEEFEALADPDGPDEALSGLMLAVDVTLDREFASVVSCGTRPDGVPQLEVVEHLAGTEWVVERCKALRDRWGFRRVALDGASPAASLIPALEDAGFDVVKATRPQVGAACGGMFDAVRDGRVRHVPHPALAAALRSARKRPSGDLWVLDRRQGASAISPLVAAVLALWLVTSERSYDPLANIY